MRRTGQYYVRRTQHGLIMQKWPRKRGRARTPAQFYKEMEFGLAAMEASDPDPGELQAAIVAAEGVPMVPRDFLTGSVFGTLHYWFFEDGTPWPRYRDVVVNAQLVLDQVTDDVGSLIWRAPVGWIGVAPGSNGQVLAVANGEPSFQSILPPATPFDAGSGQTSVPYFHNADIYLVPPSVGGTATQTLLLAANRIYFVPLIIPWDRTFTSIGISIPGGGSVVGSSVRLALYLLDPIKGGPGAVAIDAGTVTTATTGFRGIAINQALARGVYFAALWTSAAISIRGFINTFSLASCGFSLSAGTPAQCNYLIRVETFGTAFVDQSANTQTTNAAAGASPIVGIK